ncbi:NTF2 fold immunity protein [Panacagrimonas sp.]|uniref:NTF2 fold immunity protein n=1 Tax=Panacagrimonas sp. TaxID=2480088 RepID=UPI003B51A095
MQAFLARIIAGLILVCSTGLVGAEIDAPTERAAVAPAWELRTPEGQTVRFPQDAAGQPAVLLFWPSWCPYSRALQPYVQDIWEDYRERGVKLWTINILERGDPLQAMQERGLSFPLLLEGDALRNTYGITRTPWLVVIDAGQRIVYTRPPNPPSPIDVAKAVRQTLNDLLGDRAVPLPASYPPPYDLHLKKQSDLLDRPTPAPVDQAQWQPWVERYLDGIGAHEAVDGIAPVGAIEGGKAAMAHARELWAQQYGADAVRAQAPYRAYRRNRHWIVMGGGLARELGQGMIAVFDADSGRVLRLSAGESEP